MGRGARAEPGVLVSRAIVAAAVGVALLAPVGPPASGARSAEHGRPPARVIDGRTDDWSAPSPMVAGATAIVGGELVHQDHLFDDTGASGNRTARQHSSTPQSTSAGHFRYPLDHDAYAENAADLFQLRMAVEGDRLVVLAVLSSLRRSDTTALSLGFDVDGDATATRPWPRSAGVVAAGADVVVTLWDGGGEVADLRTGATRALGSAEVAVSTEHDAIEAAIPLDALGGARRVRVWAATGLWDPAAGTYRPVPPVAPTSTEPGNGNPLTSSRIWNVAFREVESGAFRDARQAAALAAGDISAFSQEVDLAELRAGLDRPWSPTPGTYYVAILDTGLTVGPRGEGVSYDGVPGRFEGVAGQALNQQFSFLGRHQPYGVYLPTTWDGRTPLPAALVLHGHGGTHNSYNQFPGFLRDMGEDPPTVLISPLARGSSFYADHGEAEVLAVLDDVERRWSIDPDRLYLTGYSMGGYGVYRLGTMYPDRFAAAVVWAGYTGRFTGLPTGESGIGTGERDTTPTGDTTRNLESFLHLPVLHLTGTNDQVVPVSGQLVASQRLAELGYRHRVDLYPGYEHLSFGIVDDWAQARAWLGDIRREARPREVVYAVSEGWRSAELQPLLALPGFSAWWVTDVEQRDGREDPRARAVVRATSTALPGRDRAVVAVRGSAASPTPHTRTGLAWAEGGPLPLGTELRLELDNVGSVAVDLRGAGFTRGRIQVVARTDGPTSILAAPARLEAPAAGEWRFEIDLEGPPASPVDASWSPSGPSPTTRLPATGGTPASGAGAVLLVAAFAARALRRRAADRPRGA